MGWLFGRKKPKIPLPEGHDEEALRFPDTPEKPEIKSKKGFPKLPSKLKEEKIPKEEIKEAVDFEEKLSFPVPKFTPSKTMKKTVPEPVEESSEEPFAPSEPTEIPVDGSLYIKMEVYQQLLNTIDGSKKYLSKLQHANRSLENSEYNEENYFQKLKKDVKSIHDNLMEIDKIMFEA